MARDKLHSLTKGKYDVYFHQWISLSGNDQKLTCTASAADSAATLFWFRQLQQNILKMSINEKGLVIHLFISLINFLSILCK